MPTLVVKVLPKTKKQIAKRIIEKIAISMAFFTVILGKPCDLHVIRNGVMMRIPMMSPIHQVVSVLTYEETVASVPKKSDDEPITALIAVQNSVTRMSNNASFCRSSDGLNPKV